MGLASSFAEKIRGHNCEKLVQYTKQEITFKGLSGEGSGYKISLGEFSNSVKVTNTVTEVMKALDNNQYLLCMQAHDSNASHELRDKCLQARVMCTIGLSNFQALAALQEPDKPLNPEIKKWIKNMNALTLECMGAFVPKGSKNSANHSGKPKKAKPKMSVSYGALSKTKIEKEATPKKIATKKAKSKQPAISQIMKYQGIAVDDMNEAISILKNP